MKTSTEDDIQKLVDDTVTSFFERDHDRLDAHFKKFQELKNIDADTAKQHFKQFKTGLQRHIVWEEDVLFPFFESKSGLPANAGPTECMREEHRAIGAVLHELHHLVRDRKAGENLNSEAYELALLDRLGAHNQKEESVLYPWIDNVANSNDRERIFATMESIPAEKFHNCCGHH